jgi:hypothetical protein
MLKNRFATWRTIFAHRWVIPGAICTVVGFLDLVRAHILPVQYHETWDKWSVVPDLSWQTWGIIGLVVVVLIVLEGSYQLVKQQGQDHQAAIESLHSNLAEAQQRLDDRAKRSEILANLGLLLQQGESAFRGFTISRASEDSRQEIKQWYEATYTYLRSNLNLAQAEAFRVEPPVMGLPDNFPLKNGGTYQAMRGWLKFLGSLVSTLSRN